MGARKETTYVCHFAHVPHDSRAHCKYDGDSHHDDDGDRGGATGRT